MRSKSLLDFSLRPFVFFVVMDFALYSVSSVYSVVKRRL